MPRKQRGAVVTEPFDQAAVRAEAAAEILHGLGLHMRKYDEAAAGSNHAEWALAMRIFRDVYERSIDILRHEWIDK